jgi:Bacterial Ig-like domain (group 1)
VQSSTVTVTLKDGNGIAVSGKAVTLAKSAGTGTPIVTGPAPATTGANGQTTFTVKSTTNGTDTFQATDSTEGSLVINQTATITFISGGYTLDGWGGIHPYGSALPAGATAYWPGWDIARGLAVCPTNRNQGYTLDGWGGIHPFGSPGPPAVAANTIAYWPGWDIARGIVVTSCTNPVGAAGYTLDGWGGVHAFGSAPAVTATGSWPGQDLAKGIAVCPGSHTGYVLDQYGGLHPFGSPAPPTVSNNASWSVNFARGMVLSSCSTPFGYTLDGYGGVHAFGSAPRRPCPAPGPGGTSPAGSMSLLTAAEVTCSTAGAESTPGRPPPCQPTSPPGDTGPAGTSPAELPPDPSAGQARDLLLG